MKIIAKAILDRYLAGTCSPEERQMVEDWYAQWNAAVPDDLSDEQLQAAMDRIAAKMPKETEWQVPTQTQRWLLWKRLAVAAALICCLGITVYIAVLQNNGLVNHEHVSKSAEEVEIEPGGNAAYLTMENGKVIHLNNQHSGVVFDTESIKYEDGSAIVKEGFSEEAVPVVLRMSTPTGGTYKMMLPDGSEVWLNAASTISFLSSYKNEKSRTVQLTGEAYFEIKEDKAKPFIVQSGRQEITVLGTHFNVNNYEDENFAATTLLEGSIELQTENRKKVLLKPGEQALHSAGKLTVNPVDIAEVIAWKNGVFSFDNVEFETIMKQIARWYNVEVVYLGKIEPISFIGRLDRNKKLPIVLKILESTGKVKFKIEGRRVIVMQ